ncbi:MAG TPA: MarC family protein [Thiotrichales bacterium]|nr:MarC family protein [Thiotrichales bacterium]
MSDLLLHNFVVLFIVVDPFGLAPIFTGLTTGETLAFRRRMAWHGTLLAAVILVLFFFGGSQLLEILGIGIPAFRVAGGVLLFLLAIDMIFARHTGLRSTTQREQQEAQHKQDISVFPLAFPLIAGPGALTTVLLMPIDWGQPLLVAGLLAVLLAVLLMTLVSLWFAPYIVKVLGETGANVLSRFLGLVLSALAAQYVLDGIRSAWLQ